MFKWIYYRFFLSKIDDSYYIYIMNIAEINHQLKNNHQDFIQFVQSLSNTQIMTAPQGKWTPGQQYEHIYLSLKPLVQGLRLPKWMLTLLFGKANRKSKSYDELVEKYTKKLAQGAVATARFTPKNVTTQDIPALTVKIENSIDRLIELLTKKFTEEELDAYVAPHPLLGKITLRKMMYFTIYHVEHHQHIIQNQL
jgi:hypothetical protein